MNESECQSDDRLAEGRSSRRTTAEPRGEVGRKSMAKRWPDEQEPPRRMHRMRGPIIPKSKVCTEGVGVNAAGISVKAGASYLGRSSGVPMAAIEVERPRDTPGEVSRGHSSLAQARRRAELAADGRNRPTGQSSEAGRIRTWSAHPEKPRRKRGEVGMRVSSSPSGESHSTEPSLQLDGNHTATETAGCVNRTSGGVGAGEDDPPRLPDHYPAVLCPI